MPQSNFLELAKQGNIDAISALINCFMQPKGIIAKAKLNEGCLQVMLESNQVPDEKVSVDFISKTMSGLGGDIKKVKIYGRKTGDRFPAWTQEFENNSISKSFHSETNTSQSSASKLRDMSGNVKHSGTQVQNKINPPKKNQEDWQKTVIVGSLIVGGMIGTSIVIGLFLSRPQQPSLTSQSSSVPLITQQTPVSEPLANPQTQVSQQAIEDQNINGIWVGTISQSIDGSTILYNYRMLFSQNGQNVQGATRIEITGSPQYYGVIQLRGKISGNVLRFEDVGVVETNPPGFVWCIKTGSLQYTFSGGVESLKGTWQGRGGCPPGEIYLEKQAN